MTKKNWGFNLSLKYRSKHIEKEENQTKFKISFYS